MVILSASCPADSPRVRSLGAQAVLPKPVGLDLLVKSLERLLARAPAATLAH
jgi:hypothetical protein